MTAKIRNTMVKLPWEVLTPFSDALKSLPGRHTRAAAAEEDEEQDEDEMQAYQDSMQRLRVRPFLPPLPDIFRLLPFPAECCFDIL